MKQSKLRQAIFEVGTTQRAIAKKAGISHTILSQAITGRLNLTEDEKTRIANALNMPIADLFEG